MAGCSAFPLPLLGKERPDYMSRGKECGAVSCSELLYLLLLVLGGRLSPGRSGSRKQCEPHSGNTDFKYSTDSSAFVLFFY